MEILFGIPKVDISDMSVVIPAADLHQVQETDEQHEQQTVEDDDSALEWTLDMLKQPLARKRGPAKSHESKPKSKQLKNQDKESQVPTGEILDVTDYGNAQETSNVAEPTKHIRDMEPTLKNIMSAIKELHKDVQQLQIKVQLIMNNQTTQYIHGPAPQQFPLSIAQLEQLLPQQHVAPLIPAHTQYGAGLVPDEWSFNQSQALNERDYHYVRDQQSPPATQCAPIPSVSTKYRELSSDDINKARLKSVQDVLQRYPNLQTESTIGALAVKVAREALFGDEILRRCTPRGWQDLPALPQAELNMLKT